MDWLALGTRRQDYLEGSLSSGVDDGDDLLVGHGLIGLYRDEGLGVLCGEDTQLLLELITGKFGGGAAVDREIIMQVGGQRDACGGRLGSRLRGGGREGDLDRIGYDDRAGHQEEDQQEEDDVRHRGHAEGVCDFGLTLECHAFVGKVRWATAQGLVHLVEHVHELHRLGLHLTTDLVKLCDEVVVSEECHDTDDKTADSGHECFVDTAREERYVDAA